MMDATQHNVAQIAVIFLAAVISCNEALLVRPIPSASLWSKFIKANTSSASDMNFVMQDGYISRGDQILEGIMTPDEAKVKCAEHHECMGFSFQGPDTKSAVEIYLKTKSKVNVKPQEKWTTLLKVDPWSKAKEGMHVEIIKEKKEYWSKVEKAGLMPILDKGTESVISEIDGDTAEIKSKEDGTKAWVPLNVLKGYDKDADKKTPPPTTTSVKVVETTTSMPLMATFESPGYMSVGCRRAIHERVTEVYEEALYMTLNKCYLKCKDKEGMKYFGITKGKSCLCSELSPGTEIDSGSCDTKCGGHPMDMCGGTAGATSTFVMIDCDKKSKADEGADEKAKEDNLLKQYGSWSGESCGQDSDNLAEVDGSSKMSGSVDECKLACWTKQGADTCHGFTYDDSMSTCTFHIDVVSGERTKKTSLSCYYKMVGFKPVD